MNHRKTYSPPQPFRIELNQEQAILSACRLGPLPLSTVEMPVAIRRSFRAREYPSPWETVGRVLPDKP